MNTDAAVVPTSEFVCPICRKSRKPKLAKKLFDVPVCKKCLYKFANRRQIAYLVDLALFFFASFLFGTVVGLLFPEAVDNTRSNPAVDIFWFVLGWVVFPFFFTFKDGVRGRSPGKWITGIHVVDQITRQPISFGQSCKRNLVTIIPIAPLILAFTLSKGRRAGDSWARTEVTWNKFQYQIPFDRRGVVCVGCGYDLTGNVSARCPECGLAVKTPLMRPAPVVPSAAGQSASTFVT